MITAAVAGFGRAVLIDKGVNSVVDFKVELDVGGVVGSIHGHLWYYFIKASGLDPCHCWREQDSERNRQNSFAGAQIITEM